MAWRNWLPGTPPTAPRAILTGVAAAMGATALRAAATPLLGDALPFITYFPFLLAASLWGGGLGGGLALGLSLPIAGLLFLPPDDPLLAWALGSLALSGGFLVVVGAAMADTVRSLRAAKARESASAAALQTVVGELAHRGRNVLTVFSSLATQTLRSAASLEEGERTLTARLDALARAQDEVVRSGGGPAPIATLITRTLEPFDLRRFQIDMRCGGVVAPEAATALALVLHELATNAVKYGALSTLGRVEIECGDTEGRAVIHWREVGGPPVIEPDARGFGSRLMKLGLQQHGGRADRRFELAGVRCELELPLVRNSA